MAKAIDSYIQFYPKDRKAWRNWLSKNFDKSPGIWLVYYKIGKTKPRLPYDDIVEEALAFGWIDSLPRKLDDERSMLLLTPRKPKSVWSDLNKQRIVKLIANSLMAEPGLEKIKIAKENGSWNKLSASNYSADTNILPADLLKKFKEKKQALANFKAFSLSVRRQFMFWIDSAKTEATRMKRIQQTVLMSEANKKPGASGFKL
jgi:uncharacterized protein YdeI (YjbR/CyaY-like superfamily)